MTGAAASTARRPSRGTDAAADRTQDWLGGVRARVALAEQSADREGEAIALLRPLFDDIGWIGELAHDVSGRLAADPQHLFGLTALQSGPLRQVLLASTPRISVTLGIMASRAWYPASPPKTYSFGGSRTLFRLLSPAPADVFRASAAMGGAACRAWPSTITPDETVDLDEARDALAILPADTETLFLRARIRRLPAPLVTSQMPGETSPRRVANGDDGLARSLAIIEMLRALGRKPPVEALRVLLPRAGGVQRWTLMREMLAADTRAAWPDLMAMAEGEEDASVRSAAASLVTRIATTQQEDRPCRH